MIDHTSPVGDVSTISTHLYKIGFLNIKEDLVKGERSAERGWKKYRVVVKGFFMELYKATKQNEPDHKEEPIQLINLDSCFVISDKQYKDGSKKVLVLRTPEKHQYLLHPPEEDNVSWTVAIEDAIESIHQDKVSRLKKQLEAAKKWMTKIEGEDQLPRDLVLTKERVKNEISNLNRIIESLQKAPTKSTSMTDINAVPSVSNLAALKLRSRANTGRQESFMKAEQKINSKTVKNTVFTNALFEDKTTNKKVYEGLSSLLGDSKPVLSKEASGVLEGSLGKSNILGSVEAASFKSNSFTEFAAVPPKAAVASSFNLPSPLSGAEKTDRNSPLPPLPPSPFDNIPMPPVPSYPTEVDEPNVLPEIPNIPAPPSVFSLPPPADIPSLSVFELPEEVTTFDIKMSLSNLPMPPLSPASDPIHTAMPNTPPPPPIMEKSNPPPAPPVMIDDTLDDLPDTPMSPLQQQLLKAKLKKVSPL